MAGRFAKMKGSGDYYVTVIEDTQKNEIIGSATLVIEHKFIHDCGLVGIFYTFEIIITPAGLIFSLNLFRGLAWRTWWLMTHIAESN